MDAKYPGVQVFISGEEFCIPGISLLDQRALVESGRFQKLAEIDSIPTAEQHALILETLCRTIRDNHPSIAREFLEVSVGPVDAATLLKLIFTTSRIRIVPNGTSP